jgi:hypothetical protein
MISTPVWLEIAVKYLGLDFAAAPSITAAIAARAETITALVDMIQDCPMRVWYNGRVKSV